MYGTKEQFGASVQPPGVSDPGFMYINDENAVSDIDGHIYDNSFISVTGTSRIGGFSSMSNAMWEFDRDLDQ